MAGRSLYFERGGPFWKGVRGTRERGLTEKDEGSHACCCRQGYGRSKGGSAEQPFPAPWFGGMVGEALVTVAGEGEFRQRFLGPDEEFLVDATAEIRAPGTVRLHEVRLWGEGTPLMETTVNASTGQTLVIGGTRAQRSGRSLILSVRVEKG
ncbi:hypothetical protein ACFL3S_13405 [Gemmatimonadota bacterium]